MYTGLFFYGLVNGVCDIGVSCFGLISGYYGTKFNIRKLVKLECMMIFFSLLETMILYVVIPEQLQGAALLEQMVKFFSHLLPEKIGFIPVMYVYFY